MDQLTHHLLEICRICLSRISNQDVDPLFEPLYEGLSLADILKTISDIKVNIYSKKSFCLFD